MTATHLLQVAAPSKPPGGRRVADAEVQRRLCLVEGLMAEGRSRTEMAAATGLSMRTLDSYTRRIRSQWQQRAETDSNDARSRALDRLMALRERLLAERAWGPLVRVEQLLCELEGVRGGPFEGELRPAPDARVTTAPILADSTRERVPILVQACARMVVVSKDRILVERTRAALSRSLSLLATASP